MKNLFKWMVAAVVVTALAAIWPAHLRAVSDKSAPEIVTNNDIKGQNTVSFFKFTGTTLKGPSSGDTLGNGIGGGFAGLNQIALGGTKQVLCGFVSDAGSSDITVFKVVNKVVTIVGKFSDAQGSGKTHGIGLAVAGSYLLAAFTTSKNIGAWQINSDCTLTFFANFKTPYAIAGMRVAPNGKALIVGYGSGVNKVDSFSLATTGLTEHGPYPATGGAAGVDITADSAYAIFGDTTNSTTRVEIYPIHANGTLGKRTDFGGNGTLGNGKGSSNVWLSPNEQFLFVSNNSSKQVTSLGFSESPLSLSYINITTVNNASKISSVAGMVTVLTTGNGGYLVVCEDGSPDSYLGLLQINADGSTTEVSGSPFSDGPGPGLQSLLIGPSRPF
jgi:hypothetical protein